jgi:surface antigen
MKILRTASRVMAFVAMSGIAGCVVRPAEPPPPPPPPQLGFAHQGPTYGADQRYCDRGALDNVFSGSTNNIIGSALGAAAGGMIGSQFGRGGGNTAMTIGGILAGALAGGAIARSMEPVDQGCMDLVLDHAPEHQSVEWQNPHNHNSYWVTPTRTEVGPDGTPCRYYTTEGLVEGRREAYTGYACRQGDGTWRNNR